ncbi:energy-coupling factor transporter transmembrane component T family protein [Dendrosporobacter sp. 1207_IL3150]|uniref:energy-coupling factor transporter transmembrane component T family protein n=1 Tax=Dendrosporobacter sp. 1207_IL3150 TaxID=3084054 RepID=UPI002FD93981
MLKDITLGQYFPGNSLIHLLDPRTKVISVLLFISSIFIGESYAAYSLMAAFAIIVLIISAIPPSMMLKSIKPLWIIILLTVGIHVFTTPGITIYTIGPLSITQEGLRQGFLMSSRLVLLIVVSSLLTYTTSPIALTDAIERLLKPFAKFGLPAHELAMMMTIALRFIPTLLEETDRIMKAQIARGADFASGSILRRAKSMIPLLVPLFISAFRRADELAVAMEARCYRGGENRSRMKVLQFSTKDWIAYGIMILLILVLVFLRISMGK